MTKLPHTLLLSLIIPLLISCKQPDTQQDYTTDWQIYKPIQTNNPDSLAMMCGIRGSRDSVMRLQLGF